MLEEPKIRGLGQKESARKHISFQPTGSQPQGQKRAKRGRSYLALDVDLSERSRLREMEDGQSLSR